MANTFIELNDVPSDYDNSEGFLLAVNDTGDAIEFVDLVGTPGIITVSPDANNKIRVNMTGTGVTPAVYGNTSHFPKITVDSYGRITDVDLIEVSEFGGVVDANGNVDLSQVTTMAYRDIVIDGMSPTQTTLSADEKHDILTLIAGAGISLVTNAANDSITFSANISDAASQINIDDLSGITLSGIQPGDVLTWNSETGELTPGNLVIDGLLQYTGGTGIVVINQEIALSNTAVTPGTYGSSSQSAVITIDQQGRVTSANQVNLDNATNIERFQVEYDASGSLINTLNLSSGIDSIEVNISGETEITLNEKYNFPPSSIIFYGYDYFNERYIVTPFDSSMGLREVSSGAFSGTDPIVIKLRLREAETGASRGTFGTTTHAWVQMVL